MENEQTEPVDCMTCLVHSAVDTCLAVVEQLNERIDGIRHVTAAWNMAGVAYMLCGLTGRLQWHAT